MLGIPVILITLLSVSTEWSPAGRDFLVNNNHSTAFALSASLMLLIINSLSW